MSETHLIEPLPLPPRRALPSDVRERMRRRVMAEKTTGPRAVVGRSPSPRPSCCSPRAA
jgi:hypothetical protein